MLPNDDGVPSHARSFVNDGFLEGSNDGPNREFVFRLCCGWLAERWVPYRGKAAEDAAMEALLTYSHSDAVNAASPAAPATTPAVPAAPVPTPATQMSAALSAAPAAPHAPVTAPVAPPADVQRPRSPCHMWSHNRERAAHTYAWQRDAWAGAVVGGAGTQAHAKLRKQRHAPPSPGFLEASLEDDIVARRLLPSNGGGAGSMPRHDPSVAHGRARLTNKGGPQRSCECAHGGWR